MAIAASTDGGSTDSCGSINSDLWYSWTAPADGTYIAQTCDGTTLDTKMAVYDGSTTCPAGGGELDCNDDACGVNGWRSRLEDVVFEAGQTYYIVVDGYGTTDVGEFSLCFETDCAGDLDNDSYVRVSDLLLFLQGFGLQFDVDQLLDFTAQFGTNCN